MAATGNEFQIKVLLYSENDEWVAHALEMDLLGYGAGERQAMTALRKAVDAQLEFARRKNDPDLIQFPAPRSFFTRWEKADHVGDDAGEVAANDLTRHEQIVGSR